MEGKWYIASYNFCFWDDNVVDDDDWPGPTRYKASLPCQQSCQICEGREVTILTGVVRSLHRNYWIMGGHNTNWSGSSCLFIETMATSKRTKGAIDSPNLVIRCDRLNCFCQLPTQLNKFDQYSYQTLFRLVCSDFDILSVPIYLYNVLPVVWHRVREVHQVVQVHWVVQSLGN